MSFLSKKKKWDAVVHSRITLGFILVLCAFLATSVYDRYVIERDIASRRVVAEEELSELTERKNILEEKVQYLSGEEGIEAEVRKHFDVAREGEQVVVLVDDERPVVVSDTKPVPKEEEQLSWWQQIVSWF